MTFDRGLEFFLKTYLPWASEDRKFTCPPKKFTFPIKVNFCKKINFQHLIPCLLTGNMKVVLITFARDKYLFLQRQSNANIMQFKRGHDA